VPPPAKAKPTTVSGVRREMANRPQTLYGIADSPVGLAAWILDHDARSYELIRVFDGHRPADYGVSFPNTFNIASH
jgi:hypothetical protein